MAKVDTLIDTTLFPTGEWVGAPSSNDVANLSPVRPLRTLDDGDSPYAVMATDGTLVVDTQSAGVTLNLPDAADVPGHVLTIKRAGTGTNAITITPAAGEAIDGTTGDNTSLDAQHDVMMIQSDGTGWVILSSDIA